MSRNTRRQIIILGLLLLLLAVVSSTLVFTLLRQQDSNNALAPSPAPTSVDESGLPTPADETVLTSPLMSPSVATVTAEAHAIVLAELEAARMLAAEEQRRIEAQQADVEALNERLKREDAARREAEKQSANLRERLDTLASEMHALQARSEALAEEQKRVDAAAASDIADPIVKHQIESELQRLEQLAARRAALEAEVSEVEERQAKALQQQIETEDAIVERGGTPTIRAPHDRRREAIRLRDQIRQTPAAQ